MVKSSRGRTLTARANLLVAGACALGLLACAHRSTPPCRGAEITAGSTASCSLERWPGREYDVHLPPAWRPDTELPVVLALHGGAGNKEAMRELTCPTGHRSEAGCLDALADREGFAVVYPNGTSAALAPMLRTWNAGGGEGDWQCVSGRACKDGVDDLAWFDALLADLERWMRIDRRRVYATGISNGAAMAWRLACARADLVAAVAPVAGGNQVAAAQGCAPARGVSVLQIHGTEDPCWAWDGGTKACLQDDGKQRAAIPWSVQTMAERLGCTGERIVEQLPDVREDGTRSSRERFGTCRDGAEVVLLRIEGGGHTWPDGMPYLPERRVGRVARDFNGNEVIWEFFRTHPQP